MDVGMFKATNRRLVLWIVVPPLLITAVGLSSLAMKQRAEWKLRETRALSNVLPDLMQARNNVQDLYNELGLSDSTRIATGDQLVALLDEKARRWNIEVRKTQIMEDVQRKKSKIPTVSCMMDAAGKIPDFQQFLNDVKTSFPLVSVHSINLSRDLEHPKESGFELKVVFDLLLVDDVLKASGGLK